MNDRPTTAGSAAEDTDQAAGGTRGALAVLLAAASLVVMAGAVISPVVTLVRDEFGLTPGEAGLVVTTHSLVIAVSGPAVGALIDRIGARRVLVAGLVAYGVLGAAGALAPTYGLLLASRVGFGIAAAAVINGMTVTMLDRWSGPARDAAMGYRATATSIGGVVWPLLGALGALGWRPPFAVYLVALPIAVATLVLLPHCPVAAGPSRTTDVGGLRSALPALAWPYLLVLVIQLLLYVIIVFLPQRLAELGVTEPVLVAMNIAAVNLAAAVTGLGYRRIRARLGNATIILVAFAVATAAFTLLAVATSGPMLLLGALLFGPSLAMVLAATPTRVADTVPGPVRGQAIAYQSSMMLLGQFVSPLLLGAVASRFGLAAVFVAAAAGSAVFLLLATVVRLRRRTS